MNNCLLANLITFSFYKTKKRVFLNILLNFTRGKRILRYDNRFAQISWELRGIFCDLKTDQLPSRTSCSSASNINPRRPVSHGHTCKTRLRHGRSLARRVASEIVDYWCSSDRINGSRGNGCCWWQCLVASRLVDATCVSRRTCRSTLRADLLGTSTPRYL